jgi:AcrR family transcriptional regulator
MSNKYAVGVAARTRLDVDARREQLIAIGSELFGSNAYDEVWVEEIAARAAVSRGLLYHYFPTKRDFFVAVVREQVRRVAELTAPDPDLEPLDRLRAAIDAHLDYVEENVEGYRAVHRAGIGADEEVRAIVDGSLDAQADRILDSVAGAAAPSPLLRLAVRSWIGFQVTAVNRWLDRRDLPRDQLRELLAQVLVGSIEAVAKVES